MAPVGTIIDITLALTLSDGDQALNATTTVAAAALGTPYFMSLDPNATHFYVPVSMETTT